MKPYKVMVALHNFRRLLACQIGAMVSVCTEPLPQCDSNHAAKLRTLNHSYWPEQWKMRIQVFMTFREQDHEPVTCEVLQNIPLRKGLALVTFYVSRYHQQTQLLLARGRLLPRSTQNWISQILLAFPPLHLPLLLLRYECRKAGPEELDVLLLIPPWKLPLCDSFMGITFNHCFLFLSFFFFPFFFK